MLYNKLLNYRYIEIYMNQSNPYQVSQQADIQQPLAGEQPSLYFNIQIEKGNSPISHLSNGLEGQARTSYIAKVYLLLTIQLAITFGICLLSQYCEAYRNFQMQNVWVIVFPILLIIGVFITAIFVPQVRRAPLDMVMLLVFIVSFSYLISMSCSAVVDIVEGPVVPIAVLATVGITLVLTIYAVVCKGNYSVMIGIAIVCGMTALVIGITAIFTRIPALTYVYCSLCISIFGIYLVIMTKLIIGGSYAQFPMDAPILASIMLYMYIVRIFLYILSIVGVAKK